MVRGCHICEASEDSDSTEHVAVTPDQGIDLGASIASLRDVTIVDTDPSEDGWGIDDDLGASEDEESAKSVVEAVARAITNYGRRCRAEHGNGELGEFHHFPVMNWDQTPAATPGRIRFGSTAPRGAARSSRVSRSGDRTSSSR